jgi:hypothetical protein
MPLIELPQKKKAYTRPCNSLRRTANARAALQLPHKHAHTKKTHAVPRFIRACGTGHPLITEPGRTRHTALLHAVYAAQRFVRGHIYSSMRTHVALLHAAYAAQRVASPIPGKRYKTLSRVFLPMGRT